MKLGKRKYGIRYYLLGLLGLLGILYIVFQSKGDENIVKANSLTKGVIKETVKQLPLNEAFKAQSLETYLKLFQLTTKKGENTFISPSSVFMALAMTGNGAAGDTRIEFEHLLGGTNSKMNEINQNYYSLSQAFTQVDQGELKINNSIWARQEISESVRPAFLKNTASYFDAPFYSVDFNNEQTVKAINSWVNDKTKGLIPEIVDQIDPNTMMYLINTVVFDQKWEQVYKTEDVSPNEFTREDGSKIQADFMYSKEAYIGDHKVDGFVKNYEMGNYSFVALMPKEGTSLQEYIKSLDAHKIEELMNTSTMQAEVGLPKFKLKDDITMNPFLEQLGLKKAFDSTQADFDLLSGSKNLYISDVLHKSYIEVDTNGTKAAAVTTVEMKTTAILEEEPLKTVILNRPFMFMIVHNETKLPLFMGVVSDPTM